MEELMEFLMSGTHKYGTLIITREYDNHPLQEKVVMWRVSLDQIVCYYPTLETCLSELARVRAQEAFN